MKFKLDENLPAETVEPFQQAGYDVETVFSEELVGINDDNLAGH